jgi:hypothetical protein
LQLPLTDNTVDLLIQEPGSVACTATYNVAAGSTLGVQPRNNSITTGGWVGLCDVLV